MTGTGYKTGQTLVPATVIFSRPSSKKKNNKQGTVCFKPPVYCFIYSLSEDSFL